MKIDFSFDDPHTPLLLTLYLYSHKTEPDKGIKNDKSLWFWADVNRFQMFQLILHVSRSDNSVHWVVSDQTRFEDPIHQGMFL